MKKLKKSMLAIIIGVCTVVVALSTVLAVVLLRKGDDGNPPPKKPAKDAEYQLTPAQLDLVNAVNAKSNKEWEQENNELTFYENNSFITSDGSFLDADYVTKVTANYVDYYDEDTEIRNIYVYESIAGTKKLVSLSEKLLKDEQYETVSLIEFNDDFISFIIVPTMGSNAGVKLLLFKIDNFESYSKVVEYQVQHENLKMLYLELRSNYFAILEGYVSDLDSAEYVDINVYSYDDLSSDGTDIMVAKTVKYSDMENENVIFEEYCCKFKIDGKTYFVTDAGLKEFEEVPNHYYEYNYLHSGVFITEYDEFYKNPKYKILSFENGGLYDVSLDEDFQFVKVVSINTKFFYVLEKTDLSLETGKFIYFDNFGKRVVEYESITDDDSIRYSDGKYILLYNKIVATKKQTSAIDYKILKSDEIYNIFDSDIVPTAEAFAQYGENINFSTYDGKLIFEEDFDVIYNYGTDYIGSLNGDYYFLDVKNASKKEIDNFDIDISFELEFNSASLLSQGLIVKNDGSRFDIFNFSGEIYQVKTPSGYKKLENIKSITSTQLNNYEVLEILYNNKNETIYLTAFNIVQSGGATYSSNVFYFDNDYAFADNYFDSSKHENSTYPSKVNISASANTSYGCGCGYYENVTLTFKDARVETQAGWQFSMTNSCIGGWGGVDSTKTSMTIGKYYFKFSASGREYACDGWGWFGVWKYYSWSSCSISGSDYKDMNYKIQYVSPVTDDVVNDDDQYEQIDYMLLTNSDYDYREEQDGVTVSPKKTYGGTNYYNQSVKDKTHGTDHKTNIKGLETVKGASFYRWSDPKNQYNKDKSTKIFKSVENPSEVGKYYTYGGYTTVSTTSKNYNHTYYSYAVYRPNKYAIELDVYGNLPDDDGKRDDYIMKVTSAGGDLSWTWNADDDEFTMNADDNNLWTLTDINYYNYKKDSSEPWYNQNWKVTMPTPSVFGYTFVGWELDNASTEKAAWIKTQSFYDDDIGDNGGIPANTDAYGLHYGIKHDSTETQPTVKFKAIWEPANFNVIFSYGAKDNSSGAFNAFVQVPILVREHKHEIASGQQNYYIVLDVGNTTYTSCSTCENTSGNEVTIVPKSVSGKSYLSVNFNSKQYLIYDAVANKPVDGSASLELNKSYYIIHQMDIADTPTIFDIIVDGYSIKSDTTDSAASSSNIKYGDEFKVTATVSFDGGASLTEIFSGEELLKDTQKHLLDPIEVTVAGSANNFLGWLLLFEHSDLPETSPYQMQWAIVDNLSNNISLVQYMKMLNDGNAISGTSAITAYALYSTKPYRISTNFEEENSSTSLENGQYVSKIETNVLGLTTNSINLNNNTLVKSKIQFDQNPSGCDYLGSVVFNVVVYNEHISPDKNGNVAQDPNKIYYIFDKIELTNFGVKIWNKKTGNQSAYEYYNATVVLEWNGSIWIVYAIIPELDNLKIEGKDEEEYCYVKSISGNKNEYAFGLYDTNGVVPDSANMYNRITINSASSTSIEIKIDYLGITGDYVDEEGKITHDSRYGSFDINPTTAEGGYYGFTINAYVKSNMTEDDDIEISEPTNSSDEDYIITTAATKVHSADGKKIFWINNIKYTLANSATAGYYQLAKNGADCSLTSYKSFLDANRNMYSVPLVYYDGTTFVHYPKQYTTHSGTTAFKDVNNNEMLTNYSNTILYAIRPEQHYIYASLHPTSVTYLNAADNKRYELNSYLSQINIGGSNFNISIDKTIETSGSNYIYSRLYLVSGNKFDPYGTDGADNSAIKLVSNCNKTISYLGETYTIHYGWYYSQGAYVETTTPYKDRSFVLYLTTHATTGEFMYFMYTDIYTAGSKPSDANEYSGTSSIKFSFTEFKNNLSLTINGSTTPDGVNESDYEVDANDKYNTTDNPLLYRYYHASAGTVNDYTSGGLRQIGSPSIKNVNFAGVDTTDANKYMTSANRNWVINPEEFVVFELQPTSGYLINNLIIKLKNQVIVNLKLDNVDGLDTGSGYYTYTHDVGILGNRTAIKYKNIASSKYFDVYNFAAGGGAQLRTGIGYAIATESNWMSGYSDVYFNPIWIMISGAYDEVEIYTTTISYTEFYINDDSNNNIGFNGTVNNGKIVDGDSDECVLDELTKLSIIVGSLNSGVKLGTNSNYDASYIQKIDRSYRIVFLGKAQLFSSGVHIYASDENYSAYFTSAQRYLDYNKESSTIVPTAFERVAELANNVYFGRNNSLDETLYWNVAGGYNTVLQNAAGDYWRSAPSFINRNLTSNDKLVYFYIDNFTTYHGARFDSIHDNSNGELEYANKYFIALTIVKNIVEVNTNTYIYNQTLTNNEQVPVKQMATDGKLPYMFNENTFTTTMQYYKDVANNRNWIKNGDAYYCYQLDYVGMLDGNDYKKQYSWFNDTVLTNIETKYNNTASNSVVEYNQNATPAAKTMSGYGLSFKYYEIPGYYLQYVELITRDYGSIYLPISSLISELTDNGDNTISNEYVVYRADGTTIISGLYYEIDYYSGTNAYFEIRFYQDNADVLAGAKSINLVSNDLIVNFYSYPQSYYMNLYSYDNMSQSTNTLYSSAKVSTTDTIVRTGNQYQVIVYDSLAVIDASLTMQGYTFVGWGSYYTYEFNNALQNYEATRRFANDEETGNAWNSASLWYDVRTLFERTNRSKLLDYKTRSFFAYDFYVKSSQYSTTTGYFITDTGYGNAGFNQENYNFWSVYAQLFLSNIGAYNPAINTDRSIDLYAIWKPNTYMLKFDIDDSSPAAVQDKNGTTLASLKINNIADGRSGVFGKYTLDTNNYLYYNLKDNNVETYYCFVTFDSTNWFIKKAKKQSGLTLNDLYNSYYTASQSFVSELGDGTNELNMVIDRYGYTWLGWFAGKQTNVLQGESAVYDTSKIVFGSKYYYNMTVPVSNQISNNYTYYESEGNVLEVNGKPMLNKSLYTMLYGATQEERCIDEIRSEFVYWGEHKVVKSLIPESGNSRYYVSHYSYHGNNFDGGASANADFYNLTYYKNGDYLNNFTGTTARVYEYNGGSSRIESALTYFDTTMVYEKLAYNGSTLQFTRTANTTMSKQNRILYLTAYWQQNLYEFVIDWQDNNGNEDADGIYTLNQYGSSEAGILQGDGTVAKEEFGKAHFDDFELSQRLNKFTPVRVGYDFIGWTFYYDTSEGAVNDSPSFFNPLGIGIDYQNYLNLNALTNRFGGPNDALYTAGTLLQSGSATKEVLGDSDAGHYVYIFAIWKPQTFTINIDLNIEWEDLENLYDIDSNFVVALYNEAFVDDKESYDFEGIRSDFYKLNEKYYTEIIANVNFVITFDELFNTAYCEVSGRRFYLEDLFATSAGYYFLGWLYNANDPNAIMVANSLMSMVSNVSNKATSVNPEGKVFIGATEHAEPRFDIAFYNELYNTNYKSRINVSGNGVFNDGENIVYFKNASTGDNYTKLSTLDKHGQSSNFGFVTINGKNYQIVSEVVQNHDGTETNYYLYFKYLGVKYYVVYYYEKNTVKTPLVNDQSFLYYKQDDDIKYIVRFDTNGRPYFVNTDYDNRTMFISSNELGNIRIAVFEKASDTANLTGSTNLLTPNDLTGVSYIFKYVSNVTMLEDGTYEKNVSSVQLIFNPKTTRQFTLYAHWQHKNDFEINIVNGNNNGGTSNSNEGLAGLYDIENIVDGHNEGKDEDGDLKAYQHHITEHYGDKVEIAEGDSYSSVINEINAQNIGYEDEKLSLTYNYYDDLNFNIVPFYNGRYLSEMTLKFYSVTEQRLVSSEDIYQMKSRFVYTTYTMVVKFGWNSSKNMIEVTNITFAIGSSPTVLNCGMQTPYDEGEYSRIYGITLSTNPISQLSILDKNSFNNYLMKLYEYSTGAVTGSIDVANNQKDATYGRNDVNKIAFNMVDVMSSIDITCRFSVQTYNVELYHFLDDDDKRDFTLQGSNRYKVGISTGEFESIVETSNKEGQEAFIAGQVATDMKLATISTDCGASTPSDTYRVPYGYYIYGMYFTSSFYPHRPVDTTSYPKTNELESASGIIRNPLYGFEWIYSNGYYTYGSTPNQLLKDGTDMAYAQSSPILGSKNKFAQSVRLDNLTSYAFVGWYEYVVSGSDVYFDQYIQSSEATYINRNIKLYGYYRPVNAPTSIVFYTWDDATKGYKVYDGNKQEYTLNAELVFNPYEADESNQNKVSVVEGMNDYVDEFGNVKINAFNNYGVNERKFNSQADLFDGGDFASGNADDEDMLDKILKTYWFYDYYYNILQFTETSTETGSPVTTTYTIKFDVEEYLNSRQSLFYYLLDDSKTDVITTKPDGVTTNEAEVMANRVYVDVFGTNEVGYKIVRDDTEIALEVVEVYEYDFDGAYLYLKLPAFGDELITLFEQGGATNIPNTERYYRLHEISSVSEYISSLVGTEFEIPSESVADSWIFKAQPRYWVEVLGVRYYILPRVDSYASGNGAKTIFDKDGNINVSAPDNPNDITTEIRYSSEFVSINNYYIDYFDKYYKVDYATYTDAYLGEGNVVIRGSEFICPYYDIETNTVTLPAEGDYPERTYYFDVENATLYYNGAPESTTPHYVYSPVNQNYDVNVAYVTDSGSSHWEYTGVTIRKLPSPNIGYWYDGGEKYGFVGYISLTEEDILSMTRRGTDGDASGENSSGEIYESFMRYIDAVYTADRYDDVSDFGNDEARMQAFIDKYDAEGSASDPLETRLSRAHATYVSRLKLSVGDKVGGYNMTEFLSNLLLAEEYLPEKDGETTVQYVHINVPVTFTNLMYDDQEIFDPRTGKSLTMSISFLKQFSLITQNTVISKNLHAIPIYSPFIMEYTEESFDVSGSTITLDVDEMHVWHFDVSGSSTTHVYRKKYGDYVNFAVLTYDQYAELKANKMNLADYFTKMIKNGKIKANFVEDNNSIATIDLDGYMSGDYVIVAYYNKTGLSGDSTYVVRVSDNLLHLSIGAAGDVTYELTTMSEYGNVTPASWCNNLN